VGLFFRKLKKMKFDISNLLQKIDYLGTVEIHVIFIIVAKLLLAKFRSKTRFSNLIKKSFVFYLLAFSVSILVYRPFAKDNFFRSTGLKRGNTSTEDVENMLGDLEDKYIDDKDKQEYIQSLEEKLLGDKKKYYLRGEDLFGDQY
jgi:hypothetical protein